MTLDEELMQRARDEIRDRDNYHELAERLKAAGLPGGADTVESIASDENRHADRLMEISNSVLAKGVTPFPDRGLITDTGFASNHDRLFPQNYGDWVNLAEAIKERYPDDPVMRASVNYQLQQVAEESVEAAEARRWLAEKAGELGIR